MSAMIAVLATPYFAITRRDGSFEIPDVAAGEYDLSVLHERATEKALETLGRKVTVGHEGLALPPIVISEAGYLPIPHKNKYGHDYPPESDGHLTYPRNKK
jgi:hypothetical protein